SAQIDGFCLPCQVTTQVMTGQETLQRTYSALPCFNLKMIQISLIYHQNLFAGINHIIAAKL
ncbi:hypothetical protein LZB82_09160, partial [Campylobacter jejuni]|nr:hypothetical protein [Campylobacter jejuni]